VDFPEEELECAAPEELAAELESMRSTLAELASGYARSRPWREGALVVLAGRVNAGKSSLMNALLGRKRAIVTDIPGTTRDFLEESLDLDGLVVRLVDTAGLRGDNDVCDAVEREGAAIGRELLGQADLRLLVVDAATPLACEDARAFLDTLGPGPTLLAANKIDLAPGGAPEVEARFLALGLEVAALSARTGQGVDSFAGRIRARIVAGRSEPAPDELVPNRRQSLVLSRAVAELDALREDLEQSAPYDLLAVRAQTLTAILAELTGEITPSEVLDSVFDSFCIGK